ncbi:recombinase family protein [Gordonia sp. 852002-51296_SCH5728562-b]|uniref:recombinase family protein n=1 Tax=Gordonia sp. 852002-51296_SCH5728562-b TaxID=1834101 RepID=UPI0018D301DE|nr:recombinase family protein [Gordonia sp. 852002-51296_SCH5728562-b]
MSYSAGGGSVAGQRVGYRRVSSVGQNADRQLDGVLVDKLFTDKASGKDVDRPELQKALDYVREGDALVVHSMDRLARNLDDLRRIVRDLTDRGVRVEFVKEGQVFTGEDNPMSNLMLSLLGAVAEFERSLIRERQREGIALAKAAGKYRGGQPKLTDEQAAEVSRRHAGSAGETVAALAREYGVSRQTVYRYLALAQDRSTT